jgi:FixJ family two-component response regulator
MFENRLEQFSDAHPGQFRREANPQPAACGETPTVFVVDGDASVRQSLEAIIHSAGWEVQIFASASAFLSWPRAPAPGCLVLDVALPDCCGLELQERLNRDETGLSTIFIMEHPDIPLTVRAMRAGAVEVFTKPIDDEALLSALEEAIGRSRGALDEHLNSAALRKDYASLSKREREVMALIVSGLLNKQVGYQLGISEITVKAHRGQVMRKMHARSFADLVHKAAHLAQEPH